MMAAKNGGHVIFFFKFSFFLTYEAFLWKMKHAKHHYNILSMCHGFLAGLSGDPEKNSYGASGKWLRSQSGDLTQ